MNKRKSVALPLTQEDDEPKGLAKSKSDIDLCGLAESTDENIENEFEKERAQTIRRNMAIMQKLGLAEAVGKLHGVCQAFKEQKKPKKRQKTQPPAPPIRKSYSLRSSGAIPVERSDEKSTTPEPEAPEVNWDEVEESDVRRYVCENGELDTSWAVSGDKDVQMMVKLPYELEDRSLLASYSMDVSGSLLVAGGKQGHASIFGIKDLLSKTEKENGEVSEESIAPLLSARLHRGWISQVQFIDKSALLISAGNDGVVSIWDTSKALDGMPREASTNDSLHSGGIFSMHEWDGRIVTGSKDTRVVLSEIGEASEIRKVHAFDDMHSGVVKCVRWRDKKTFVSAGNDRSIQVTDSRSRSTRVSIDNAHDASINCVAVSPANPDLILSAASDPILKLFDLRAPAAPLFEFQGHAAAFKIKNIYQPSFWMDGQYVVTSGEKSKFLSMYCTKTGRTVSRGNIGYTPTMLRPLSDKSAVVAAATTRAIRFYGPQVSAKPDVKLSETQD
ncbi:hypothetical protein BSKO_07586 [Bryopsis sp. KO-2023]|nr:hypothetical protein BSKO_07586 [Bryopsis sp. KO-2023]